MDVAGETFLIMQGVHRSVAAREAGLTGVLARVEAEGAQSGLCVIALDRLVSPKSSIARWDRGRDFLALVAFMRMPEGRAGVPPVIVERISPARAGRYTPLRDVVVLEEPEEDLP